MNLSARSTIGEPGRSAKITVEAAANDSVVLRLNDKGVLCGLRTLRGWCTGLATECV